MNMLRRAILAAALFAGLTPAFAQAPAPVPALPDTERRTSYSISGTTCSCAVNFALYADGTDVDNWLEVWISGVRYLSTDVNHGWTITSPSGSIGSIARPITNAVLTFNAVQTGTVQIVGARRPRRTAQFTENAGVSARNLNQVLTDIISQNREIWDKTNDVSGRSLLGLPGESITTMPPAATRAGKFLYFDATGLIPQFTSGGAGTGNVVGPASSTIGNLSLWNNTSGTLLSDSGILGTFTQPVSYPPAISAGHVFCALDADCQFGNGYSQYPLGSVSANPLIVGKAGSTIGSSTLGQTFKIVFTSTGLTGSPITKTYTAGAAETTTTIAAGLCALVNADTVLHGTGGKPIFCQSLGSGVFNLQYDAAFSATGATPLTTATTGSTGTITLAGENNILDFVVMQLGRNVPGRAAQAGDALYALDFTGQDSTGIFNTNYGQITLTATTVTAGGTRGLFNFNTAGNTGGPVARIGIGTGLYIYDSTGVAPSGGDLGGGTFNLPTAYYFNGTIMANSTGLFTPGNNLFGGTAAGAALNLQSTQSGAPVGDFVQITTGGTARWKWLNGGAVTVTNIAAPASPSAGFGNVWYDSTDLRLHDKNSAGTIGTTVVADTGAANNFLTAISASGVISKAQPSFSNLSGNATGAQGGTGLTTAAVGDIMYASATTPVWSRLADVAVGAFLASGGVSTAPAYCTACFLSGNLVVGATSTSIGGTKLLVHAGVDQNFAMTGPINLADGVGFISVNDANNATKSLQFNASQVYYNADVSIGTTTNPALGGGLLVGQAIKTLSTTAATSATTGSGIFGGGLGVAGAIWAGTYINITPTVVNSLPGCAAGTQGARALVTNNATAIAFNGAVTTGGSNITPVFCDGTNWKQG